MTDHQVRHCCCFTYFEINYQTCIPEIQPKNKDHVSGEDG